AGVAQDGGAAAPDLRPDARAQVGDRDGRLRELGRDVQQLRDPAVGGQDRPGRHLHPGLPAAARAADGGDHPPPRGGAGGRPPRLRAAPGRPVSLEAVPGFLSVREAHGETTLVVETASLREACARLRDEGFNFLSDIAAADYLGYGGRGVAGYIGTSA